MKKPDKNYKNIDSDNDGLSDFDEINKYHTNPNNPDTDGDGLNDCDEIQLGLNPLSFRDYFIPNKCNNYKPKALRPKRLLFYGLSAVVTKLIVVAVFVSVPLTALLTPDLLYSEGRKIINLTNEIRQNLGVGLLTESQKLDEAAMYKVEDMLVGQYFAHTSPSGTRLSDWMKKVGYNYAFGGENLAIGFEDASGVIEAWKKSPTHYANMIDPDFKEIGVGAISGQYNQYDTVLIAQYFGTEKKPRPTPLPIIPVDEIKEQVISEAQTQENTQTVTSTSEILGSVQEQNVLSEKETISVDEDKTKLIIQETPITKEQVVKATAYLSDNTNNANIKFQDQKIELIQNTENENEWSGSAIITDEEQKTLIPGILEATDNNGNKVVSDVKLENIIPQKTSISDQYTFIKKYRSNDLNTIFTFSSIYYKIILALTLLLLLINIFVKIKIQRLDVVFSSLVLMAIMVLFIMY